MVHGTFALYQGYSSRSFIGPIGPIGPMRPIRPIRPITSQQRVAKVRVRLVTGRLTSTASQGDGLEVRRTAIGTAWGPWTLGFLARWFGGDSAS